MSFLIILEFLFFNFKHTLFTLFISSTVTLHGFIFLLKDYHRSFTVKCLPFSKCKCNTSARVVG